MEQAWQLSHLSNRLGFALLAIISLLVLTSCAGSPYQLGNEARQNRENMIKVGLGQSKEKVLAVMGHPYKTETYSVEGQPLEFWFYLTEAAGVTSQGLSDSNFTPFAFENGVLQGWGRNYYDKTLRIKKDITIEEK